MKYVFCAVLLALFCAAPLTAQNVGAVGFDAFSLRMLTLRLDAEPPETRKLQNSYGAELTYRRQLFDKFAIALPLRAGNADVGEFANATFFSADLLLQYYPLGNERGIVPALNAGAGVVWEAGQDNYLAVPLGLDVNFSIGRNMWLSTRTEYRAADLDGRNTLVFGLGYVYRSRRRLPDSDGDGVPDRQDRCPQVPGARSGKGCPDTDGDGIIDPQDDCPAKAGPKETFGCPDYDEDGVPDDKDQCPYEAGVVRLKGCPDIDGDGVPDDIDACPNTPGSLYTGCPDTDGDGFEDHQDDCPATPGTNRGCPEITPEIAEQLEAATNKVTFPARSERIEFSSYPALDGIAVVMLQNPTFKLIVEGHTDNTGSDIGNQQLSELRALAVRGYLMAQGVDGERIGVVGYGATRPRADNATAVGRELNRRVTFGMVPK